jgi:D-alanyl-D-alanine dipeptidase
MHNSGFVGHPFEWWHFSIGDQLWAKLTGVNAAFYGPAADFS